jgi:lysophospholipase L1-like esterase
MDAILDRPSESVPEADAIEAAALPVFDLLDVFPADRRDALRVAPWDEHPNAAGHELIAQRLYPKLKDFLTTEFGPR